MAKKKTSRQRKTPPLHELKLATKVADNVSLDHIVLRECHSLLSQTNPSNAPAEGTATVNLAGRHEKEEPSGKSRLICLVKLSLSISQAGSNEQLYNLDATYQATYSVIEGCRLKITSTHIHAFSKCIALFGVWPYWREFAQSTAARMGVPAITVPLLHPGMIASLKPTAATNQSATRKKAVKRRRAAKK